MPETNDLFFRAFQTILAEVFHGPPGETAFLLNPGDPGLLRQLDAIDASAASTRCAAGETTVAAHADHLLYGLELLNRWAGGEENPWATADWSASWKRKTVSEEQWRDLMSKLRAAAEKWQRAVADRAGAGAEWNDVTAAGALASAAHTAYHLGAIRQILVACGKYVPKK
jgi:hypothetical protein